LRILILQFFRGDFFDNIDPLQPWRSKLFCVAGCRYSITSSARGRIDNGPVEAARCALMQCRLF
jgi:hypothetical protein